MKITKINYEIYENYENFYFFRFKVKTNQNWAEINRIRQVKIKRYLCSGTELNWIKRNKTRRDLKEESSASINEIKLDFDFGE